MNNNLFSISKYLAPEFIRGLPFIFSPAFYAGFFVFHLAPQLTAGVDFV